jgi:hypothetical protein
MVNAPACRYARTRVDKAYVQEGGEGRERVQNRHDDKVVSIDMAGTHCILVKAAP